MSVEFRVRWQREGRAPTTRIYQTETAARRKVDSVLALEEVKGDTTKWADMPDLVEAPVLQVRDVSEWRTAEPGAQKAPSLSARRGVAEWAGVNDTPDDGRIPF